MTVFEVIGKLVPDDDHGPPLETIEDVNAELNNPFRFVSYYETGSGNSTEFYLVKEFEE